jgi:hypothetical protein
MRTTVRATRSYMAGLGTSGSLVTGAALLFLLGSAIVAFQGWPQIATGPATTSVAAASAPVAPSRAGRRLTALLRRRAALIGTSVAGAGARRSGSAHRGTPTRSGPGAKPRGGNPPTTGAGVGAPTGSGATTASGSGLAGTGLCAGNSCNTPQRLVTHLADTVSQQVTSIGSKVGSQASSTGSTVAAPVSSVSPQGGNVLQSAGNTAGGAVSGTATTVGNAATQLGNALGGGH